MKIPEYKGGIKSPEIYDAGVGFVDNRSDAVTEIPYFEDGAEMSEAEFRDIVNRLDIDDVTYNFQYAPAGSIGLRMFKGQRMIWVVWRDGVVHAHFVDDYCPGDQEHVTVTTIIGTTEEEYDAYCTELEKCGLKADYSSSLEKCVFREYITDDGILRVNYMDGTVRIIDDKVSLPLSEFGDSEIFGSSVVYQYGIHHGRNRGGFTMDCGMCYVIKLPDGELLMIDGGRYEQCSHEAAEGLIELMHELGGEKIRLNWFCTHAHDDHMDMFAHILKLHHDEIELRRVMFNFPDSSNYGIAVNIYMTINRVKKYYPGVKYRKLHTGDRLVLGGCPIDVLQTHEESTAENGNEKIGGFNDTSTVLRIHMNSDCSPECRFLVLGDIDGSAEKILLSHWTADTLKAGMVQVAHHCFNYLNYAYDIIDADIALLPQTERERFNHDKPKYDVVARTVPYDGFYFSDSGTDGFGFENGNIVHLNHRPRRGGVFDGEEL